MKNEREYLRFTNPLTNTIHFIANTIDIAAGVFADFGNLVLDCAADPVVCFLPTTT